MSNVAITQRCNRACPYCFAADAMSQAAPGAGAFMPDAEFSDSLDFLARSGVAEVTLLGGEPTIHPRFCEMVDLALARGFRVLVLSGGIIPERALARIETAAPGEVAVMLNVAPPGVGFSQREEERQSALMARLGRKIALGLNIDRPSVEFGFLLEWIARFDLERVVRLGIAHPIEGGVNRFLHPRDYAAVGRRTAAFMHEARAAGVHVEFDCGWVPCMFPEGVLSEFGIGPEQIGLRCNPILDVLPGRQIIACYPLASIARAGLPAEGDGAQVAAELRTVLDPLRPAMLYKKCADCDWRARGECTGGCIAGSLRRVHTATLAPAA